ncbi:hypothetical protein FRB98_007499 [Tulasnella sp. 332]|nr:hypothetical protein FRB98_007499 [Tulasnella sp. 332]
MIRRLFLPCETRDLQARYENWTKGIASHYGSACWDPSDIKAEVSLFEKGTLYGIRLEESKRLDTMSLEPKSGLLTPPTIPSTPISKPGHLSPEYFTADMSQEFYKILLNEWPYSVPIDVEHFVFWSRVPIIHPGMPSCRSAKVWPLIEQDGLWGFTGSNRTPAPRILDHEDDSALVQEAHKECMTFVMRNWPPDRWETAWLVNPLNSKRAGS